MRIITELLEGFLQTFRKVGEFDEREFIHRKEAEAAANKLTTPPSMSKCQVRTPVSGNRYKASWLV